MKLQYSILVFISSLFILGCSDPEKKALDSFKPIVNYLSGLTNSDGSTEFSDFSFNVSKSDSPVSPFTGLITFERHTLMQAKNGVYEWSDIYTCRFVEQAGKWVHESIEAERKSIQDPDPDFAGAINEEVRATLRMQRLQSRKLAADTAIFVLNDQLSKFLNCPLIAEQ